MRKTLFLFLIFLPLGGTAQTITDKSGYTVHLSYYDEITIEISNRIRFIGDGYDEVMITKKAIITDGEREFTDKVVKAYVQKPAFWIAFLRHHGFALVEEKKTKAQPQSKVEEFMTPPKNLTLLVFNKQ